MEVMKQLRQRAIRDLVVQRPYPHAAGAGGGLRERGFRTTQATISRDVAELGSDQGHARRDRRLRAPPRLIEAETSGEDRLRKLLPTCRSRSTRLACCSSCAPCQVRARHRRRSRPGTLCQEVAGSIKGDDTLFVAFRTGFAEASSATHPPDRGR